MISVNTLLLTQVVWKDIKNKHKGVKYPCNQCENAFTSASSLRRHIENKHETVRHPCDQCDHAATTASKLKRHIESKH